jgi:16S rRNA (cytidine1402-2'-O)-methyltransferase
MEGNLGMAQKTVLHLLPVPISETERKDWIGPEFKEILKNCRLFFVENERTARRFISSLKLGIPISDLELHILDKETKDAEIQAFGKILIEKSQGVIMSESGCPGLADPGSKLVAWAHQKDIDVRPWVGPSSIFLALMASGLSGQSFAFQGYLPVESKERALKLKQLEKESQQKNQTQIFIETPYRNQQIWNALLEILGNETRLGFGFDLQGDQQKIRMKAVGSWKSGPKLDWKKLPAVFFFMA